MDGAVYAHLSPTRRFREEYAARFGNELQLAYAGNGYDTAVIIVNALNAAGSGASPEQRISALKSAGSRQGVLGASRFRETDEGGAYYEFPIAINRINGDSFAPLEAADVKR